MKLKDKIAIVAGGAQGIGEGIVRCLAEEGADIVIADINDDVAKKAAASVNSMGNRSLPVIADLTNAEQSLKVVKDALDFFGRIDILINNVGGVSLEMGQEIAEYFAVNTDLTALPQYMRLSPAIWDKFYQLNLKSHVMLSQAVTPYFIKQRSGKIVNISSVSGRQGEPGNMAYAAMKSGDISFTWSLARALAPYNINVNCVCPGIIYTPLWERGATGYLEVARNAVLEAKRKGEKLTAPFSQIEIDELENITPREFWLRYIALPNIPMGREQTPEDIGRAVIYFVSDDARNVTGQVLHVDGGMIMR